MHGHLSSLATKKNCSNGDYQPPGATNWLLHRGFAAVNWVYGSPGTTRAFAVLMHLLPLPRMQASTSHHPGSIQGKRREEPTTTIASIVTELQSLVRHGKCQTKGELGSSSSIVLHTFLVPVKTVACWLQGMCCNSNCKSSGVSGATTSGIGMKAKCQELEQGCQHVRDISSCW